MPLTLIERFRRAIGAFRTDYVDSATERRNIGPAYSMRPDRVILNYINDRSIVSAIYNRIAIDVSNIKIRHVRVNEIGNLENYIESPLDECLNVQANIDQTSRAFIIDAVLSMFDEGVVAIVPVVNTLRTAKIVQWYPRHVMVELYNDETGRKERVIVEKASVAIIENPLFAVMNEPNSTIKRLTTKLAMLDRADSEANSGKIDLIVQLPYPVRSAIRKKEAEERAQEINEQLSSSKYGIAYMGATEKITQLNRAVENNLLTQIEYLTKMAFNQMGVAEDILNGTADEAQENNYYTKTIEPIVSAICDEIKRKFLTKTARSQGQSIMYFRDPFKLMPISQIADTADKLTRNAIVTSNEFRAIIGYPPSNEPIADELSNKNIRQPEENAQNDTKKEETDDGKE